MGRHTEVGCTIIWGGDRREEEYAECMRFKRALILWDHGYTRYHVKDV